MSFNRRMDKYTGEHLYHGLLFSSNKETTTDTHNFDESPGNCAEWKQTNKHKKIPKGHIPYDPFLLHS